MSFSKDLLSCILLDECSIVVLFVEIKLRFYNSDHMVHDFECLWSWPDKLCVDSSGLFGAFKGYDQYNSGEVSMSMRFCC